jgi:hypothetical protein
MNDLRSAALRVPLVHQPIVFGVPHCRRIAAPVTCCDLVANKLVILLALDNRRAACFGNTGFGVGAPQQGLACIAKFLPGGFHELSAELLFADRQARWGAASATRARVFSRPVKFEGVVLRRLSDSSGADELNDLLREPDGMHQLVQVPGIVAGF